VQLKVLVHVFVDYDAAHKYSENLLSCFVCGELDFFHEREQQELDLRENIFSFLLKLALKAWGRNFLFLVIMSVTSVPNLCKSLASGTVIKIVHQNVIALADVISHFLRVEPYFWMAS
jgi:hypothetical protein